MARSEMGDPIADVFYKIVIAFVAILTIVFIFPASLSTFGIFLCSGCDILTQTIVFGFVPLALVFASIYFIWRYFST